MKERPILFSGDMVRAILAGRKTQTRRVMKPQPPAGNYRYDGVAEIDGQFVDIGNTERYFDIGKCRFGVPGDRLWVRETFGENVPGCGQQNGYSYRADHWEQRHGDGPSKIRWIPSIHMPRDASRTTLEVTGVRAERLQDISEEDAKAEGARKIDFPDSPSYSTFKNGFAIIWNSICKKEHSWHDNPWVWVIEFRRMEE